MTTKFLGWPLERLRFHIESGLLEEADRLEMAHELLRRIDQRGGYADDLALHANEFAGQFKGRA